MIPRRLHFIYLGEPIPAWRRECIDSCISAHPGYEVTIWTSVAQFGLLHNRRVFFGASEIAPPSPRGNPHQIRTNVLRFEIMLRYGGVFLDSDVTCLRSIDPLLEHVEAEGKDGMLGWEIQDRWLGEAVIAAEPGAGFLRLLVDRLEPWVFKRRGKAATVTVGPQFVTPNLRGTPELDRVLVMPQVAFFPARHDQPELSDAIASGEKESPGTWLVHRFGNHRRKKALGIA